MSANNCECSCICRLNYSCIYTCTTPGIIVFIFTPRLYYTENIQNVFPMGLGFWSSQLLRYVHTILNEIMFLIVTTFFVHVHVQSYASGFLPDCLHWHSQQYSCIPLCSHSSMDIVLYMYIHVLMCACRVVEKDRKTGILGSGQCWEDHSTPHVERQQNGPTRAYTAPQ